MDDGSTTSEGTATVVARGGSRLIGSVRSWWASMLRSRRDKLVEVDHFPTPAARRAFEEPFEERQANIFVEERFHDGDLGDGPETA
jgi:hypothetical protein